MTHCQPQPPAWPAWPALSPWPLCPWTGRFKLRRSTADEDRIDLAPPTKTANGMWAAPLWLSIPVGSERFMSFCWNGGSGGRLFVAASAATAENEKVTLSTKLACTALGRPRTSPPCIPVL